MLFSGSWGKISDEKNLKQIISRHCPFNNYSEYLQYIWARVNTLWQDLTKDSATLTGWRRSQQSGEGKMIPLLGPGIYNPKYRVFPVVTEFSGDLLCEKMLQWRSEGSNSHSSDYWSCPIPLDHSRLMNMITKYKNLTSLLTFPAWRNAKYRHRRGAYCPSPMLLFYIPPCRKTFPAWRNVIYQHGRGKKCSGTTGSLSIPRNAIFQRRASF